MSKIIKQLLQDVSPKTSMTLILFRLLETGLGLTTIVSECIQRLSFHSGRLNPGTGQPLKRRENRPRIDS